MKRREVFLNTQKCRMYWNSGVIDVRAFLLICLVVFLSSHTIFLSLSVSLGPIVLSIYPPIRLLDIFASFYLSDSITEFLGRYSVDDIFSPIRFYNYEYLGTRQMTKYEIN